MVLMLFRFVVRLDATYVNAVLWALMDSGLDRFLVILA